ncbi:ADP-ribosylation factor-like protein 8 [Astathelohania contejeani]|uniref:ADP-ribosylation factor-like protein 8 n=1 Tax=Astathelohania contejeani TaxID=164912 RepID=A0ABQ7I2D0_9MICR|nr:ADP-ribosylation factor-like protein 8 [Thelohania contejeani]
MTRLFEGRYDPNTPTSQNVRLYRYEMDGIVFFVYDIPGNTSSRSKWDHYYKKSDIIVFFIDGLCDDEACAQSREELKSLIYRNMWIKKSLLVIGTKNDEPKALLCRDIILRLDLVSIVDREIACYSVSSLKDTNIDLVKSWLLDQVD